jgi:hypothetical protein
MSIIRKSIQEKQGLPPSTLKKITEDSSLLTSALELFDRVLVHVTVEPNVQMPPACTECGEYANKPQHDSGVRGSHKYVEGERDKSTLYADQVLMDDKTFIFQWCLGGTRDLEQFRKQADPGLGVVPDSEDLPLPTL